MLNERLKERHLFSDERKKAELQRKNAKRFLNSSVKHLVTAMKCVEADETMTRKEVENFIIKRIEHYEATIYQMNGDDFNKWMTEQFAKDLVRLLK